METVKQSKSEGISIPMVFLLSLLVMGIVSIAIVYIWWNAKSETQNIKREKWNAKASNGLLLIAIFAGVDYIILSN